MSKQIPDFVLENERRQELRATYLYELTWEGSVYRYTCYDMPVEWKDATWTPQPIKHERVDPTKPLTVQVGMSAAYLQQLFLLTPPTSCSIIIYRVSSLNLMAPGPTEVYAAYAGSFSTMSLKGGVATLTFAITSISAGSIPGCVFSRNCNWTLFKDGCWLKEADYTIAAQVTNVELNSRSIAVNIVGKADAYFNLGRLMIGNFIARIEHSINEEVQHRLVVVKWPPLVQVGDQVRVIPGCDGSGAMCRNKYNNYDNFGGQEWVPFVNPTVSGVG